MTVSLGIGPEGHRAVCALSLAISRSFDARVESRHLSGRRTGRPGFCEPSLSPHLVCFKVKAMASLLDDQRGVTMGGPITVDSLHTIGTNDI